jgi:hypothetical protein
MMRRATWIAAATLWVLAGGRAEAQQDLQKQFELCQDSFNLGKYDDAQVCFEKVIDLDKTKPGPWRWLGRTALAQKRYEECVRAATQAMRINPKSSQSAEVKKDIDTCRAALGRPAYPGTIPEKQGALAVIANVEGAAVLVDGIKKGATPLAPFPLNPGAREVHVERKGYLSADVPVDVVVGIVVDVEVVLEADPNASMEDRLGQVTPADEVKVGWLVAALTVPGAMMMIDGKPVTPGEGGTIEGEPGIHTVEVTAEGHEPWRRRVVVVRGQKRPLAIGLKKTEDRRRERRLGYIAFGAAAAAGAAGVVFGLLENSVFEDAQDWAEIERTRPAGSSPPAGSPEATVHTREDLQELADKGARYALISNISYGAAAVALGVSIYYFIQERSEERKGYPLPMAIVPTVGPEGEVGTQVVYTKELW